MLGFAESRMSLASADMIRSLGAAAVAGFPSVILMLHVQFWSSLTGVSFDVFWEFGVLVASEIFCVLSKMGECCGEKPGRFVRVIKKISKTKVPGPEPLAQSSFRRPKKVLGMQIPRGYAPPKIDPNVMDYRISKVSKKPAPTSRPSSPTPSGRYLPGDAKVRMHFPDASHGNVDE